MNLTLYIDKAEWDRFVSTSPHGNVFCKTPFLDSLGVDYELWMAEEHGSQRLGAIVLKDDAGQPCRAPFSFSLYQGLLFDEKHAKLPPHNRGKDTRDVVEFLLTELERRYTRISFCLHPQFEDLRSFSWFHYHEAERGQFWISLNYTGLIDLKGSSDFEGYLATIRQSRRYEYRQAPKEGLTIEISQDIDTLEALYRLTFERQRIELDPTVRQRLRAITKAALSEGFGELLLCRDAAGEAVSATLFLHDERSGYYLIGANHPAYRHTGSGTFLVLENIRRCQAGGLKWVDVCGMNSPNRGDFKASFNAAPVPYFVVTWENPSGGIAVK